MAPTNPLPKLDPIPLLQQEWFCDAVLAASGAFLAALGIWGHFAVVAVWIWIVGLLALIGTTAWKILRLWRKRRSEAGAVAIVFDDLAAAAHICHAAMAEKIVEEDERLAADVKLRVTIHGILSGGAAGGMLEQKIDYVGSSPLGGKGRKFSVSKGVIGKAAREMRPNAWSRGGADYETWLAKLVERYGYDKSEAKSLCEDEKCGLAVPILSPEGETGTALAVLYFGSGHDDALTSDGTIALGKRLGKALANYIGRRYGT